MKIRNKPNAPKRKKNIRYAISAYGFSLADCQGEMETHLYNEGYSTGEVRDHASMDDIQITSDYEPYDDNPCPYIRVYMPESDKSFDDRMKKYNKRMLEYSEWYHDNKVAIEAEKERRANEKNEQEAERLRKQMDKLQKKMDGLKL